MVDSAVLVAAMLAGCGGPRTVGDDLSFLDRPLAIYGLSTGGLYRTSPEGRVSISGPCILPQITADGERFAYIDASGNLCLGPAAGGAPLMLGQQVVGVEGGATVRGVALEASPDGLRVAFLRMEGPPGSTERSLYVLEPTPEGVSVRRLLERQPLENRVLWSRAGDALYVRRARDFCPAGNSCRDQHVDRVAVPSGERTHVRVAHVGEPVSEGGIGAEDFFYNRHVRYPVAREVAVAGEATRVVAEGRLVVVRSGGGETLAACVLPDEAPEVQGVTLFPEARAVVFLAGGYLYLLDLATGDAGPIGPGYGVVIYESGYVPALAPGDDPFDPRWDGGVHPAVPPPAEQPAERRDGAPGPAGPPAPGGE